MKLRGPILTLAVVAGLALVLLLVNLSTTPTVNTAGPVAQPSIAAPATPAAPVVPPDANYAGRSSGNEVTVAISIKDGKAAAYLCDGKKIEAWLNGTATGNMLSLQGKNGAGLTATIQGDAVLGTVQSTAAQSWPFSAKIAKAPAGLYRALVGKITYGWTVQQDGTVTGLGGDRNGATPAAPGLDPATGSFTIDGQQHTATLVAGGDRVVNP